MNFLPYEFYDSFASLLPNETLLLCCEEFSGAIARAFYRNYEKQVYRQFVIENERLVSDRLIKAHFRTENRYELTANSVKVQISHFYHDNIGESVDAAVIAKFAELTDLRVSLQLCALHQHYAHLVCQVIDAIPAISSLEVNRLLFRWRLQSTVKTSISGILERIMEKKTLNCVRIGAAEQLDAGTTKLFVDLMKESQFYKLQLLGENAAFLQSIILEWTRNPSQMAGKQVWCREVHENHPMNTRFSAATEGELEHLRRHNPAEVQQMKERQLCSVVTLNANHGTAAIYWIYPHKVFQEHFEFSSLLLFD